MGAVRTKTFKSGNSVAVRLPAEFGFAAGLSVTVERDGSGVKVRPMTDPVEEKRKVADLVAKLRALGPVGEIQVREPIEFPDRPGL
jgi:antitoxin VapB